MKIMILSLLMLACACTPKEREIASECIQEADIIEKEVEKESNKFSKDHPGHADFKENQL
jgi:hypothetical protein